jgi:hypothetical protein
LKMCQSKIVKEKEHQNTRQSDLYSGAMSPLTN